MLSNCDKRRYKTNKSKHKQIWTAQNGGPSKERRSEGQREGWTHVKRVSRVTRPSAKREVRKRLLRTAPEMQKRSTMHAMATCMHACMHALAAPSHCVCKQCVHHPSVVVVVFRGKVGRGGRYGRALQAHYRSTAQAKQRTGGGFRLVWKPQSESFALERHKSERADSVLRFWPGTLGSQHKQSLGYSGWARIQDLVRFNAVRGKKNTSPSVHCTRGTRSTWLQTTVFLNWKMSRRAKIVTAKYSWIN